MFSGPVSGWAADRWGRKCAMMFTGIPCLAGYLILSYAHYSSTATTFVILLFTGRFISGVGMGCISSVVSVSRVLVSTYWNVYTNAVKGKMANEIVCLVSTCYKSVLYNVPCIIEFSCVGCAL